MRFLRLLLLLAVPLLVFTAAVVAVRVPCLAVVVAGLLIWRFRKRMVWTTLGSASWAGFADVRSMFGGDGVPAGMMFGRPSKLDGLKALFNPLLAGADAVALFVSSWTRGMWKRLKINICPHVAVFSPTGGGKSTGFTIPYLLSTKDSVILFSPKNDELIVTRDVRGALGPVHVLDPFGISGMPADTLNPLAFLNPNSPSVVDDCRDFSGVLLQKNPLLSEPFFDNTGRDTVAAFLLAMVRMLEPDERTLSNLRYLLAVRWNEVVAAMQASDDPALVTAGHSLGQLKDKTLASVQATIATHLCWIDSPAAIQATNRSTFDPWQALQQCATVYLLIPPQRLQSQTPLLRSWLHVLMLAASAEGTQSERVVRVIVEEAAQLGQFDIIDRALAVGRGFGIRLLLLYQTISQLKKCFPEGQDQTVISNVGQVFIATNDNHTAEYISNRIGNETVVTHSGGSSHGRSGQSQSNQGGTSYGHSDSDNAGWALQARLKLQPNEVLALDPRQAVVFVPGMKPILTWIDRYYEQAREGIGPVKASVWTLLVFLAALAAAVFAASYQPPTPRYQRVAPSEVPDGEDVEPASGGTIGDSRPTAAQSAQPGAQQPVRQRDRRGTQASGKAGGPRDR